MGRNTGSPDQYQLRFPPGLRERVKKIADINGRSMNAEIVARLERVISPDADGCISLYLPPGLISRIERKAKEDSWSSPESVMRDALETAFPREPTLRDYIFELKQNLHLAGEYADEALKEFVEDTERRINDTPELGDELLRVSHLGSEVGPEE